MSLAGSAQLQQMMAVGDDIDHRHRFLVELVAAGLDARQIEDLVDEVEQMDAGIMDVGRIFLVDRDRVPAKNFALHHLGEAEDGVERRAQLVAHLRQEARLGDIGRIRRDDAPRPRSIWPARARRSARPFRRAPPASPAWSNAGGGRAGRNSLRRRRRAPPARNCRNCRRSTKFSAIATVTGTVAASAAIGRFAASMLETAITSSIRNIITVSETAHSAGWIRIAIQPSP